MNQFVTDFAVWLIKFLGISLLSILTIVFVRRRLQNRRQEDNSGDS